MTHSEFSRPIRVDTIGESPRSVDITAEPEEREALAKRFGLERLDRLEAELSLVRADHGIVVTGRIAAEAVQSCVATGAPVTASINEPFTVHFRPEPDGQAPDEEVEIGEEDLDIIFFDGAMVDAGEAAAQTLALALDPYPRAPGAVEALREAGVKDEGEAGPFGALAALKDKLEG